MSLFGFYLHQEALAKKKEFVWLDTSGNYVKITTVYLAPSKKHMAYKFRLHPSVPIYELDKFKHKYDYHSFTCKICGESAKTLMHKYCYEACVFFGIREHEDLEISTKNPFNQWYKIYLLNPNYMYRKILIPLMINRYFLLFIINEKIYDNDDDNQENEIVPNLKKNLIF